MKTRRIGCALCRGSASTGWVCEEHPDKPWEHDGCGDVGAKCICNPDAQGSSPRSSLARRKRRSGRRSAPARRRATERLHAGQSSAKCARSATPTPVAFLCHRQERSVHPTRRWASGAPAPEFESPGHSAVGAGAAARRFTLNGDSHACAMECEVELSPGHALSFPAYELSRSRSVWDPTRPRN
jgi:hypothetical protein